MNITNAMIVDEPLRKRLVRAIRDVPDFPKPGVLFKDITPFLADAELFRDVISSMAVPWKDARVTHVAGIESRGFILAAPIAVALGAGFIPIRKPGKLPWRRATREYAMEYGADRVEIHVDACVAGSRVLLVDDVLATGGTAAAAAYLIQETGAELIGCSFLMRIAALGADARLHGTTLSHVLDI